MTVVLLFAAVESELIDSFNAAAQACGRFADDVLRELVVRYVEGVYLPEKSKRREAFEFARANVVLSGFKPTPQADALARVLLMARLTSKNTYAQALKRFTNWISLQYSRPRNSAAKLTVVGLLHPSNF